MTGLEEINKRGIEVARRLKKAYPNGKIALQFNDPFQLLVAVILSAQCTDVRVNKVTPVLFKRLPDARAFANAPVEEIEELIRSTGFFRNKAKNIKASARMIVEEYGDKVPETMAELVKLPGVARKTANVVIFNAFGRSEGIAVDTHVKRLSNRLGLTKSKNPEVIEKDLMKKYPRSLWGPITYLLIEHGRAVCKARKPACSRCVLNDICPSAVP